MTTSNNSPPPGPKGWNCPCGCPRGSNKSNWTVHQWHFRKSEASFPWLVQTVCLLLAVVFGSYWNFRPWRNSQPQELVMGLCHEQTGTQYNVCVIIENWVVKITKPKAPRCSKEFREGVLCYLQKRSVFGLFSKERHATSSPVWPVLTVLITSFEKRRQKWTLKTFYETV